MRDTSVFDESVRRAIYRHLAATGAVPDLGLLTRDVARTDDEVGQAIARLADERHVVLDDSGAIVMAHPFATMNLDIIPTWAGWVTIVWCAVWTFIPYPLALYPAFIFFGTVLLIAG